MPLLNRKGRVLLTTSIDSMDASSLEEANHGVENNKMIDNSSFHCDYRRNDDKLRESESTRGSASSNHGFEIAQSETRTVNMLRALLLAIIVLATCTVSSIIYVFLRNEEEEKFQTAFLTHSSKITESVNLNVKTQLATLETFAVTLTSFSQSQNATFPFVSLPQYEKHAHSILSQLKSLSLLTVPLVTSENRAKWEEYALANFGMWSQESLDYQRTESQDSMFHGAHNDFHKRLLAVEEESTTTTTTTTTATATLDYSAGISKVIHTRNSLGVRIPDPTDGPYFPIWQNAPFVSKQVENNNLGLLDRYKVGIDVAFNEGKASMGRTANLDSAPDPRTEPFLVTVASLIGMWGYEDQPGGKDPFGFLFYPIRESQAAKVDGGQPKVVGAMIMYLHWRSLFLNILPPSAKDVDVVFESICYSDSNGRETVTDMFTYRIQGNDAVFLSASDVHDVRYDYLEQSICMAEAFNTILLSGTHYDGVPLSHRNCEYTLRVYPTDILHEQYTTNAPVYYALVVVGVFFFAGIVFALYDLTVELRQRKVMRNALTTNAIVTSLFPGNIATRMIEAESEDEGSQKQKRKGSMKFTSYMSPRQKLKSLLSDGSTWSMGGRRRTQEEQPKAEKHQQVAELFPSTTVMVADICGFSSWSSARDPNQVFTMLETIFFAFDNLASKQKVFKVETNADSYTAVTGLPDKQPDHAIRMARFAIECMRTMNELIVDMEAQFGPDTGELKMRIGLHSGPAVAGVMKGARSRFQLFGDTVTTAACLESTSQPNHVQLSRATAQLLQESGHEEMLVRREEPVPIKGKGLIEAYFLVIPDRQRLDALHGDDQSARQLGKIALQKKERLIQWNVKILKEHLQKVVARRRVVKGNLMKSLRANEPICSSGECCTSCRESHKMTCLEELEDIISMPPFDPEIMDKEQQAASVNLGFNVELQLQIFVRGIANRYHNNKFHNFEHASHVAMSVDKLLNRIVAPDIEVNPTLPSKGKRRPSSVAQEFHHFTHGITSDPLTHFAVVLSALIHDVDHRGISNAQLAKENPILAEKYKNKSVAEQNSFDIAWDLLMQDDLRDLRCCIFSDHDELHRFRQTVIKTVLATDIFDKELNDLRKKRWAMAFADSKEVPLDLAKQEVNVKATIVIEHLIQASDVSHTMQHWHIYRKWNERLFAELYEAYRAGRMGKDPSTFWYQGELGFFDNYIIPLAKKLKECQVFGVSSAEFLSYAMANREEWQQKGAQLVAEMVKKYEDPLEASEHSKENSETVPLDEDDYDHSDRLVEGNIGQLGSTQLDRSCASNQGVRRLEEGLSELEAELEALTT